jgi:hypothetical protein
MKQTPRTDAVLFLKGFCELHEALRNAVAALQTLRTKRNKFRLYTPLPMGVEH